MNKGCVQCFEIAKEPIQLANKKTVCEYCGGSVLDIQELLDYIAELKSELNYIHNTSEDGRWEL